MQTLVDHQNFTVQRSDDPQDTFTHCAMEVRLGLSDPTAEAPPDSPIFSFVLDTGAEYTVVSQILLEKKAGLDPRLFLSGDRFGINGGRDNCCIMRDVTLWLYCFPSAESPPFPIDLDGGVVLHLPEREGETNELLLLGMDALVQAGLHIEVDAANGWFSIWAPIAELQADAVRSGRAT